MTEQKGAFSKEKGETKKRPILALHAGVIFVFLYLPLGLILFASFVHGGPIFEAYQKAFTDPHLLLSLKNSLVVGSGTTLFSTVLGTTAALALRKKEFLGRSLFESLLHLPLVLPEIVMGLALLIWFVFLNLSLGLFSIILAHTTFTLSYVTLIVLARIHGMDPLIEEAAQDLGATPFKTFLHVTLPYLAPAIISGALLAFTLSFDDFLLTFFTAGVGSDTLPVKIYSMLRFGVSPEINAISSAVLLFTLVAVVLVFRIRKE